MDGNPKDVLPVKPGGSPGGKGQVAPPKPAAVDVVTVASVMSDDAQAQAMVTTSVVAQFNVDHGAEMGALNGEIAFLDAKKEFLGTEEKTIKRDLEAEKPIIACAPDGAVTYWAWTARDKIEAPLLGVCIVTSILAAVLVAHGNMVASGIPIFLEEPWLPWAMAGLIPLGSFGIKTIVMAPALYHVRQIMMLGLYALILVLLVIWVALFASQYHGVGGSFDPFAEASSVKEIAFVGVQLLAEMLTGAALAARLTHIFMRYAPDTFNRNAKREELLALHAEVFAKLSDVSTALEQKRGRKAALQSACDAEVEAALGKLQILRERNKNFPL